MLASWQCSQPAAVMSIRFDPNTVPYAWLCPSNGFAHQIPDFNVVAVAVSGESKSAVRISTYLHTKGAERPKLLQTKGGKVINAMIPWLDYIEHATFDPTVQRMRASELMAFSRDLHDFMRDHAKLTESQKPLLVSGTLIALRSRAFAASFDLYPPDELQTQWMRVIRDEIHKARIPKAKKDKMAQPYTNIAAHPVLGKSSRDYPKGVLHELIRRLNEKVWPFISVYHDFDVVGRRTRRRRGVATRRGNWRGRGSLIAHLRPGRGRGADCRSSVFASCRLSLTVPVSIPPRLARWLAHGPHDQAALQSVAVEQPAAATRTGGQVFDVGFFHGCLKTAVRLDGAKETSRRFP